MKRESLLCSTGIYILWNHCCCFIESMFALFGKTRPSPKTCRKIMFFHTKTRMSLKEGESFKEGWTWIQGSSGFMGCKRQSQWFLDGWLAVGRCRFLPEKVSSSSDYWAARTDILILQIIFLIFWITSFLKGWAQLSKFSNRVKIIAIQLDLTSHGLKFS